MASLLFFAVLAAFVVQGAWSTSFTFQNKCSYPVWPAAISGANSGPLPSTGFELQPGASQSLDAPPKWSGRMWARHRCSTDSSGKFSCLSGDCGTGQVQCGNSGGVPPTNLAEFTLQGDGGKDFYDVSNVDGFNVPLSIAPQGVAGCHGAACPTNINGICPQELQYKAPDGSVVGCKSACLAFGSEQYCCTGAFADPNVCKPTNYSQIFKNACPQAYSYAYDDATSTFTCTGANYLITYCP
ncbi:thaumatin-like protein 1b [Typha latifolia]|uniref:thaumatin-like protein 1b n=1 Tax=Typha latifolia TaxID=4733 RepID=UPI003C2D8ECD